MSFFEKSLLTLELPAVLNMLAGEAVREPAKVAQFRPKGPGVISAMATISATSCAFIHPWDSICS